VLQHSPCFSEAFLFSCTAKVVKEIGRRFNSVCSNRVSCQYQTLVLFKMEIQNNTVQYELVAAGSTLFIVYPLAPALKPAMFSTHRMPNKQNKARLPNRIVECPASASSATNPCKRLTKPPPDNHHNLR
jgi:hypothetical protein